MGTYTARTIADGEETILLLPDEIGWPTGTEVKIWKEGDRLFIRAVNLPPKKQARTKSA